MAHQKHSKSHNKGSKKQAAAKNAAQKKLKDRRATKFRNEELRAMLDNETSAVYSINTNTESVKSPMQPGHEPVQNITKILENL